MEGHLKCLLAEELNAASQKFQMTFVYCRVNQVKKRFRKLIVGASLFFFASTILTTLLYSFLPVPLTPFMLIRMYQTHSIKFKKDWVPLSKISDELSLAVIASEDQLFLDHFGFDIKAIEKAMYQNERTKGRRIKGASTISQQTAKNVFLWPGRSWFRKGLEIYFTSLIEIFWTKERILEVYLNIIEMGKGVYGAQAASRYYYRKDASKLDRYEAAALAAILPNPAKFNPNAPSPYLMEREQWILDQMWHLRAGEYGKLFDKDPPPRD